MIKKVLPFLVFMTQFVYGQKKEHPSFLLASDTLNTQRLKSVCIGQGALWVGSMVALNQAWYAHYPRSSFHFFNDNHEWNQIDKVGHSWSAYWGTQFSSSLFRWSGMPRRKAAIYGAGMGIAYEGVIEILDGFSTKWGFSLGDMAANTSGSLLYATQEYAWGEQRIEFKFSTHGHLQKAASSRNGSISQLVMVQMVCMVALITYNVMINIKLRCMQMGKQYSTEEISFERANFIWHQILMSVKLKSEDAD